jgi:hypothetical protein
MEPGAPIPLINNEFGQHYGAILTTDVRDHALAAYTPLAAAGAPLPEAYYPNLTGIPYWMQNQLGACVGHAAAKAEQIMKFHESGATKITPYSARFLYAYAKCIDGNPTVQGTDPRVVAKIMRDIGVATEATCPNNTLLDHATYTYNGNVANIPAAAIAEAGSNGSKISNFAFADITEAGLKAAIQFAGENRGGVFMLTEIDKNWWTAPDGRISWAKGDVLADGLRVPTDPATLGGHETVPYAFDVKNGRSIFFDFNSWSPNWCSTSGNEYGKGAQDIDGGFAWGYIDEWLPHIRQIITVVDIPQNYVADKFTYTFKQPLRLGMSGSDVVALQHLLRIDGEFTYPTLTGYFGGVTLAAVEAFQSKYASEILAPVGLTQPTGFVGASTLKKLNELASPAK